MLNMAGLDAAKNTLSQILFQQLDLHLPRTEMHGRDGVGGKALALRGKGESVAIPVLQ